MDPTTGAAAWISETTTGTIASTLSWVPQDMLWTLIFGFVIAFVLAFAVGANDVANSFGTTVGAKVLTLKTACILASIFETLGAVLLGAKVGETIRKGIIDVTIYNVTEDGRELLMIGEVSAMTGSAIWQLIATTLGLPVSGTHSIVGACIGFSLVAVGPVGVNWKKLALIIASWFISPVLSGIMAVSLYFFVKKFILDKEEPLENGLRCLPFFYAFTFGINCFSIFYTGAPLIGLHLETWCIFLITLGLMVFVGVFVMCLVVPRLRRKAEKELLDDDLLGVEQLKRPPHKGVSPSPVERKKMKTVETKMNDSGYQTPNGSQKKESLTPDRAEILVTKFDGTAKSEEDKLLSSAEGATHENGIIKTNPSSPIEQEQLTTELLSSTLNESSSYDGDDDSAYGENDESFKKDPEKAEKTADGNEEEDPTPVRILFSALQILTACFGSFAHGGNDVSNAIGPLIALWLIYHSGNVVQKAATPWYILMYGGVGIVFGLWILGRRVIKTIGSDLTKITPSRGFCIELMTALTVLLASNVGIPISTTHCKVGSVVSIGWFRSRSAVTWKTVRNIALAWFVTVPVSGLISAGVMYILLLIVG